MDVVDPVTTDPKGEASRSWRRKAPDQLRQYADSCHVKSGHAVLAKSQVPLKPTAG